MLGPSQYLKIEREDSDLNLQQGFSTVYFMDTVLRNFSDFCGSCNIHWVKGLDIEPGVTCSSHGGIIHM